jgi:hypothetical protein
MSQPHLGQPVLTKVDPRANNGEDVAPALITRVKGEGDDQSVNLRVFLDTGADLRVTDVKFATKQPDNTDNDVNRDASGVQRAAWPVKK